MDLVLDPTDGQGLHWLYEHSEVMSRADREDGLHLTIRVAPDQVDRVRRRFPAAA
jgi:GTP-binding protein HflX